MDAPLQIRLQNLIDETIKLIINLNKLAEEGIKEIQKPKR